MLFSSIRLCICLHVLSCVFCMCPQKSKQDIDKPKAHPLEDILVHVDMFCSDFFFLYFILLSEYLFRPCMRLLPVSYPQKSKQDIDKPKVQSLEDILKELDEPEDMNEDLETERLMEALLAGEMVSASYPMPAPVPGT